MNGEGDQVALASFVLMSVLAGGNAVAIRFSNRELDPLWGASVRFALAAALLLTAMAALRLAIPRGPALLGAVVYGALTFGAAFALAYYALVEIHAGFGQTLLALVPLATLLLAVAQRQERLSAAALGGALIALVGVAVMSQAPLRDSLPLLSLLAALGAALCFAEGAILVRWFPPVHPVTINAIGMATGAVLLAVGSVLRGETISAPLKKSQVFPPMVISMINVGEQTGGLDEMLTKIADFYDEEVDAAVSGLLALMEPMMIVFLGIVVGGMVVAMYLPIFDMVNAAG